MWTHALDYKEMKDELKGWRIGFVSVTSCRNKRIQILMTNHKILISSFAVFTFS